MRKDLNSGFRPLTMDEIDYVAGGEGEQQEADIVVTAKRISTDVNLFGGGSGGSGFGGFPSFSGLQGAHGGAYSVTYWDTDALVTEYFDANGHFTNLEASYADIEPPADDASPFVTVGASVGYAAYGASLSLYGLYPYAGYGSPGLSASVGYTNSSSGYLTGDGASGSYYVGGGISENGEAWAVSAGTPGLLFSRGYTFSGAVEGLGGYIDRFIMEN